VYFFAPDLGLGGTAVLDENGDYQVKGAVRPGNYLVTIVQMPHGPPEARGEPPRPAPPPLPDYLPKKYLQDKTTDLQVQVAAGKNRFDFDLKP
jgi:hypothetical protein